MIDRRADLARRLEGAASWLRHHNQLVDAEAVYDAIAEFRRPAADAEAIKRDFDTIEIFLGEAENYELADDSTVDITGPFDAMERIRGLVRRLSPAEEGWRPIESAPDDGRDILVWSTSRQRTEIRSADGGLWRSQKIGPSWWRPLPAPP